MQKNSIKLSAADRQRLRDITKKGREPARVIRRAYILLQSDGGMTDAEIARHTGASHRAVVNVRTHCALDGVQRALYDAPRSGKPVTFTGKNEAEIVAIACSKAPEGCVRWTMKLLAEEAIKRGIVKTISPQSVWLMLERQDTKPWLKKNVVHSQAHSGIQGTHGRHSRSLRKAVQPQDAGRLHR